MKKENVNNNKRLELLSKFVKNTKKVKCSENFEEVLPKNYYQEAIETVRLSWRQRKCCSSCIKFIIKQCDYLIKKPWQVIEGEDIDELFDDHNKEQQ